MIPESSFQDVAYRGSLGMEGRKAGLESLGVVILPLDQGLASEIIHSWGLGGSKPLMVGPPAGWVHQPASHPLDLPPETGISVFVGCCCRQIGKTEILVTPARYSGFG